MNGKSLPHSLALPLVSKPPVESFFNRDHAYAVWPQSITARQDFREQIDAQQILVQLVQTVFAILPSGTTLAEGLAEGLVTEVVAIDFLNCLSDYLEKETAYQRIIFYLPLELTSPIKSQSALLCSAADRFQRTYRKAWELQLKQHDVRANFVDGDVLEVEKRQGDPLRVVKATHLIPGLIQSGHLTFYEVVGYAEKSPDELFKSGVVEACAVMLDNNLITRNDLEQLRESSDPYLIQSYVKLREHEQSIEVQKQSVSIPDIETNLEADVKSARQFELATVTPNRLRWLREQILERAIMAAAKQLCDVLDEDTVLPNPDIMYSFTTQAYVEALRLLLLQKSELSQTYRVWLTTVAASTWCNNAIRGRIVKLYRHAYTASIVSDEVARETGAVIPSLAGPFSENLGGFTPSVSDCEEMIVHITRDTYLSSRVYPVAILFGSQLKGYGAEKSDADVAIFIKPGTPTSDHLGIASRLKEIFNHERIGGSVVMFWLEKKAGRLIVTRNTQTTDAPPLYTWTHVLMGGAWIGEVKSITTLQHNLLTPHLFNPTVVEAGKPVRERWLEEMERDSILYRLLHKGFERYYPVCSPLDTTHGKAVDGSSAFYDPMFRRIATELFLTRVFFPNLDQV